MGDTLRLADQKGAYTLSDSGTYLAYKNKITLVPYITNGSELLNIYTAIPINPKKIKSANYDAAMKFIEFLLSKEGTNIIGKYGENKMESHYSHHSTEKQNPKIPPSVLIPKKIFW
ncbi:MAG: hypothetical protein IPG26_07750 [Coprothermobacter sp.]|nr:hypothetical protein [Coprothermobacter sp.]